LGASVLRRFTPQNTRKFTLNSVTSTIEADVMSAPFGLMCYQDIKLARMAGSTLARTLAFAGLLWLGLAPKRSILYRIQFEKLRL